MKFLFALSAAFFLLVSCSKNNNAVLIDEATVTILHSTCVKTILKIEFPTTTAGVRWSDSTKTGSATYQQVFEAGVIENFPVDGLQLSMPYKIKIYAKATGPEIICTMFDPVNSPSVRYDIEFLK